MNQDDEILEIFLEESREHLSGIEADLLEIEQEGEKVSSEVVNRAFRAIHSIKGAAGFFDLNSIKNLAHAMENILDDIRNNKLIPTSEIVSELLKGADLLNGMINSPETIESTDIGPSVERLTEILEKSDNASETQVESAPTESTAQESKEEKQASIQEVIEQIEEKPKEQEELESSQSLFPTPSPKPIMNEDVVSAAKKKPRASSLRVNVTLLDSLMSLAGELVLARNQLLQGVAAKDIVRTDRVSQRVNQITTELQDAIMSTRMQPVEIVFSKFRRIVRDLSTELGKSIDLTIEGEDVELDKTIIETIGDPLTHLIRNAADHGIEDPDTRRKAGKSATGSLRLTAINKGGQVVIEIEDDGKGIDPEAIKRKALAMGIISPEALKSMSRDAIIKLIFAPGFSTAQEVTSVSGRGVGMDVVHSNINKLGGSVDISSEVGKGTLLSIQLPLTLSIIPSLMLIEGGHHFAIPQANLLELQRIRPEDVQHRIERIGNASMLRSRGELLPLTRLAEQLGMPQSQTIRELADRRSFDHNNPREENYDGHEKRACTERRSKALNIAVVESGDYRFGLVVDSLEDSSEVVVKPLGYHLRNCREYAGATILGDGRPALIIDVMTIGQRLFSRDIRVDDIVTDNTQQLTEDQQTLMIVENGNNERFAIHLGVIERIDRTLEEKVQTTAGRRSIQHRNKSLLVFEIDDVANVQARKPSKRPYLIVFKVAGREVSLVVSRIVDTIDSTAKVDRVAHAQPGIHGSLIVDDRLVLLLDPQGLAISAMPELAEYTNADTKRILVADDSPFFLETIASFLEEMGHETIKAKDGKEAYSLLDQNPDVSLVVTDIEMPNWTGFEFTEALRKDKRFSELPVIAVTSLMGEAAEQRGREAGIDHYLTKLDRDQVTEHVNRCLSPSYSRTR